MRPFSSKSVELEWDDSAPTSAKPEPEQIFEDESSTETESSDDETDEPKPGYVGDMVDGKKHGEGTTTYMDGIKSLSWLRCPPSQKVEKPLCYLYVIRTVRRYVVEY